MSLAASPLSQPPAAQLATIRWNRDAHLRSLGDKLFDLLVIGGGATGCSIARDAALRGLEVGLVDRADLASGTSSRSTRFIHGGLRYLRSYEFGFVREGLQERAILLNVAPHLVRPIEFLLPAYRGVVPSRWLLRGGVALYDLLAGGQRLGESRLLTTGATLNLEPGLRPEGLGGSVRYSDAGVDDARLVVETALSAVESGATVALHVEVERIVPSDHGPSVVLLRDRLGDAKLGVRAAVVVNAAGPWAGSIPSDPAAPEGADRGTSLRLSRGSHLVVAREALPVSRVVVLPSRRDGRLLFAVPSGEYTYLGTTEIDHQGSPDDVRATREEVDYILGVAGEIFREAPARNRVLSTWSGVRPLVDRPRQSTANLSRDFRIVQEGPGILTIVGGKLTSCRRMAEVMVDLAARILTRRGGRQAGVCITRWKLFPGAEGPIPRAERELPPEVDPGVTAHLVAAYGARAAAPFKRIAMHPATGKPFVSGCPVTPAEAMHAVENEGVVRLGDFLFRRLHPLFMEARLSSFEGQQVVEGASRILAACLGWPEARRLQEVADARREWERDFSVP